MSHSNSRENAKPDAKRRGSRRRMLIVFVVVVLAFAGGTAALTYTDLFVKDPCGGPKQPTGVETPHQSVDGSQGDTDVDTSSWLKVVDSGIAPYKSSHRKDVDDSISFGFLVKNTSKYVLYNATVKVEILGADGQSIMQGFPDNIEEENARALDSVDLPVVFPGQEVGFGGSAITWVRNSENSDGEKGEHFDPVDYDKVALKMSVDSGEWWVENNDVHDFINAKSNKVNITESTQGRPSDFAFHSDGTPWEAVYVSHRVTTEACRETDRYNSSGLVYDSKGKVVGGTSAGSNHSAFSGRSVKPGSQKIDQQYTVPAKDGSVKMFSYLKPLKPRLED